MIGEEYYLTTLKVTPFKVSKKYCVNFPGHLTGFAMKAGEKAIRKN